jgi:hypothetical protein
MDCLKYLVQKGYDMEKENVCYIAVEKIIELYTKNGHLECLKILHEKIVKYFVMFVFLLLKIKI